MKKSEKAKQYKATLNKGHIEWNTYTEKDYLLGMVREIIYLTQKFQSVKWWQRFRMGLIVKDIEVNAQRLHSSISQTKVESPGLYFSPKGLNFGLEAI